MHTERTAKLVRTALGIGVALMLAAAPAAAGQQADTAIKDAWITTQVQAKYFLDPIVKGRNIDVDTAGGVVTLSGTVTSAAEQMAAVNKAREVDGVTKVVDNLKLTPPGAVGTAGTEKSTWPERRDRAAATVDRIGGEISDTWITTKIQSKYFLDGEVKGTSIDVTTSGGIVTLAGEVGTAAAREKAVSLARSTDGVKNVVDKLTVK